VIEPLVYTVEEAAELLGIGRSSCFEAVKRGEIPSVRLGRRILIPKARLHELLTGRGPTNECPERIDPPEGNGRTERMPDDGGRSEG
jgi:excisionase family DNA binding protein